MLPFNEDNALKADVVLIDGKEKSSAYTKARGKVFKGVDAFISNVVSVMCRAVASCDERVSAYVYVLIDALFFFCSAAAILLS